MNMKVAFALSPYIGGFIGARSTTPRPDTPSSWAKEHWRDYNSQIEHLEHAFNDGHAQTFVDSDSSFHLVFERP